MALVKCKECGENVAASAKVCPHCGVEFPASYVQSEIQIHRESSFIGILVGYSVSLDGESIGFLRNDETITSQVSCGSHLISVGNKLTAFGQFRLEVIPSKIYQIEMSISLSLPYNNVNFSVIEIS